MAKEIVAAGGVVLNSRGELLMIFRRGKWDLPKGKLDEGEDIESCAVREVEEETGVSNIQLQQLIGTTLHVYVENEEEITKKTYWYSMQVPPNQSLKPQYEEGIEKVEWVAKSELPDYLSNTYDNIREIITRSGLIA